MGLLSCDSLGIPDNQLHSRAYYSMVTVTYHVFHLCNEANGTLFALQSPQVCALFFLSCPISKSDLKQLIAQSVVLAALLMFDQESRGHVALLSFLQAI